MKSQIPNSKLILALDVDSLEKARYFVNLLYPKIKIFKVGIQPFIACGPEIIEFINKRGAEVFLDLKFFDIPHTVANALRQGVRLKVKMLTLHILGGEEMLKAAVKTVKEETRRLKVRRPWLIGVTVLTSKEANFSEVLRLTRMGLDCGLDGVVCSAGEVALLRKKIKKQFIIVTPGIRLARISTDDQNRIATPEEAIKAESDFLVIGRPILEAKDPVAEVEKILRSH